MATAKAKLRLTPEDIHLATVLGAALKSTDTFKDAIAVLMKEPTKVDRDIIVFAGKTKCLIGDVKLASDVCEMIIDYKADDRLRCPFFAQHVFALLDEEFDHGLSGQSTSGAQQTWSRWQGDKMRFLFSYLKKACSRSGGSNEFEVYQLKQRLQLRDGVAFPSSPASTASGMTRAPSTSTLTSEPPSVAVADKVRQLSPDASTMPATSLAQKEEQLVLQVQRASADPLHVTDVSGRMMTAMLPLRSTHDAGSSVTTCRTWHLSSSHHYRHLQHRKRLQQRKGVERSNLAALAGWMSRWTFSPKSLRLTRRLTQRWEHRLRGRLPPQRKL